MDALSNLETAVGNAVQSLERSAREIAKRDARVKKLEAILEEIREVAFDNYDGPEDTHWGAVVAWCERGLIG